MGCGVKRARRPGEVICTCGAYDFPHRWLGGRCDGSALAEATFEAFRTCKDCWFYDKQHHLCEVVEGREAATRCPAVEERMLYEGVKK